MQFYVLQKKPGQQDSFDEDEEVSRSVAYPKVAQSRNDTQLEVAQTLYGRSSGKCTVKFIVSDILGKGHYGLVFLAEEETTGTKFAIKVMRKEQRNINKYAYIEEAVLRMSRSCPFIIHLFSSFQTTTSYYLVMEHANGGNLKQIIDDFGCLTIESTKFLTAELILALHFLHSNGVIHRDLKIQNILMTTGRHIRLIDFGLSRMDIYDGDTTNSGCGTPFYMAPEILRRIPYSHEVDWWAMGVLIYKLFPFMGKTNPEVFVSVTRDSVYYDPHLPIELVSLLKGLLRKNPSKRLGYGAQGWRQIQTHQFFAGLDWLGVKEQTVVAPTFDDAQENEADTAKSDEVDEAGDHSASNEAMDDVGANLEVKNGQAEETLDSTKSDSVSIKPPIKQADSPPQASPSTSPPPASPPTTPSPSSSPQTTPLPLTQLPPTLPPSTSPPSTPPPPPSSPPSTSPPPTPSSPTPPPPTSPPPTPPPPPSLPPSTSPPRTSLPRTSPPRATIDIFPAVLAESPSTTSVTPRTPGSPASLAQKNDNCPN